MTKQRYFFIYFFFLSFLLKAQEDSLRKNIFKIGTQFHYGSIFAHSEAVENTSGSRPFAFQADFIWQKISKKVWENCNCYPKTGFSLAYNNYNNQYLGQSFNFAYFLEPYFKLNARFNLSFRTSFGGAWLSNPYDVQTNPNNQSYSLPLSVYLAVGIGSHFKINSAWSIGLYGNYQHISNGGVKEPNKGINWVTSSLSVVYTPKPTELPVRERNVFSKKNAKLEKEIFIWASNKEAKIGDKKRFFIFGTSFQIHKQVSRLSALSLGTEIYYDGSLVERLRQDNENGNGWRSGLLAGHQFILGKFRFTQQIGVYVYQNNPYFDAWYHRWAILYYPNQKWGMGISLKAHRHIANFFDVRISKKFIR
ncbi:MAG: acyloxyacyl hydrolase [Bacteroidetes bacterium]|nr:MAG: acyloxyacyl hydrolase [Bacteroidota bacterium]TAG85839.1 MAG: acyloxyacyl hydrolase [Bacteroidota bacterium]